MTCDPVKVIGNREAAVLASDEQIDGQTVFGSGAVGSPGRTNGRTDRTGQVGPSPFVVQWQEGHLLASNRIVFYIFSFSALSLPSKVTNKSPKTAGGGIPLVVYTLLNTVVVVPNRHHGGNRLKNLFQIFNVRA